MNFPIFLGCVASFAALAGLVLMALSHEDGDEQNAMIGAILFCGGTFLASIEFALVTA